MNALQMTRLRVFSSSADGESPPSATSTTVNHINIDSVSTMDL